MRIYVVNLGTGNRHWPTCLAESVLTLQVSSELLGFWRAGDKPGWARWSASNETTMSGRRPIEAVTSRWYNLLSVFAVTDGDVWVHGDGERLFWTKSVAGEFEQHAIPDPFETGRSYFLLKRRCEPWRDVDGRGRRLEWRGLHQKSHDFLRTEATFQEIANDRGYRDYVDALLAGDSLEPWHRRPDWQSRAGQHGMVRVFDPLEITIEDAVRRVEQTSRDADGREVVATRKIKELNVSPDLLRATLLELYREQEGHCALTGQRRFPPFGRSDRLARPLRRRQHSARLSLREFLEIGFRQFPVQGTRIDRSRRHVLTLQISH